METFARMRNEGNFEIVAEVEENSIMTKGLINYYDFSDSKLIDRKLCMKVDEAISKTRDTYPEYTSFDTDWKQGTYDVYPGGNHQQTGYIDVSDFNFTSLKFLISGEVLVEVSKQDYPIKVGIVCYILKGDGTKEYSWGGAILGNSNELKEKGWVDIFKKFSFSPGGKILYMKPWIQIDKSDSDTHEHHILYKNITIEPDFETIEKYTIARYIKLVCSGAINPLSEAYINQNNLYKIEVIDVEGNNVALGKTVTANRNDYSSNYEPPESIVTENPRRWNEFSFSNDRPNVEYIIDLGDKYKIKSVRVNEWNFSTRKYLDKVYTSVDKNAWSLLNDTYTPFKNNEKKIYNDLPVTPHTDGGMLEYNLFGEYCNNCINSVTPLSSLASHLDNALIFNSSKNTNISWVLDNSAPTISRVVAKFEPPTGDLVATSSCRIETPKYRIKNFDNMCFATAWVKVDKDYDGGAPYLKIEDADVWTGPTSTYDLNRKGEWQKLTVYTTYEDKENGSYFAFVRNIWNGKPSWSKGNVYVSELTFGGNPFNSNNFPYIENLYPTTFYKAPVANIKNKGTLFIEFDLNCFNNRDWMSFFHIYSNIKGDVESKKINLIFHNKSRQLQVRINNDIRKIYTQGEYKAIDNRLCIRWGDDGIYSILNGVGTKLSVTNVITGDYENFCLGCWDKSILEVNNNIYKLAIYDESFTNEDAIQLTKPDSRFSLTDTVLETHNLVEGYNIPDTLTQSDYNYFQLADSFKEYTDKNIELKNIYDYNDNAFFYNDALLISPRFINRWKKAFGHTEYSYKNTPNIITLSTYSSGNNSITISFIYNTHELTDEKLNLNITLFNDERRDITKIFPLEQTGDIYKQFEVTIPTSSINDAKVEFSITGQGYARLKNVCICPVAYLTHPDIVEDDTKKLGFSMNLKESIGHEWDKGFTIVYKKKAIATSTLSEERLTGYNIDALGSYESDRGYLWFGKMQINGNLATGKRTNTSIVFTRSNIPVDVSLYYDWYTVAIVYNPIAKILRIYYIFIDGTIEYIEVQYINGYGISYSELESTVVGTNFKFDFSINGWNNNNSRNDACAGYLKDLLIVKRSMDIEEIKEILSPLSLGVDSIRAGMEISERNIL